MSIFIFNIGDPLPPYNGKLRVYNMRYCPFAQRTILALNAKQIDYEVVNIDLIQKPEWLPRKSPLGESLLSILVSLSYCFVGSENRWFHRHCTFMVLIFTN